MDKDTGEQFSNARVRTDEELITSWEYRAVLGAFRRPNQGFARWVGGGRVRAARAIELDELLDSFEVFEVIALVDGSWREYYDIDSSNLASELRASGGGCTVRKVLSYLLNYKEWVEPKVRLLTAGRDSLHPSWR